MDPAHSTLFLCSTAAIVGFLHTLLGPDHYLPFLAMSRVGHWSLRKTVIVTLLCGLGHVASSVVLGFVGIGLGLAVFRLEAIDRVRSDLSGWLLIAFGVVYTAWGLRRAIRRKPHTHWHRHADGTIHQHEHVHTAEHLHVHENHGSMTPWVLFTIFLFGPCEPLIVMLMYPAARGRMGDVAWVTMIFGTATIVTMTALVVTGYLAVGSLKLGRYGHCSHVLAGLVILLCGVAIQAGL